MVISIVGAGRPLKIQKKNEDEKKRAPGAFFRSVEQKDTVTASSDSPTSTW
jgi:hypothetical protein